MENSPTPLHTGSGIAQENRNHQTHQAAVWAKVAPSEAKRALAACNSDLTAAGARGSYKDSGSPRLRWADFADVASATFALMAPIYLTPPDDEDAGTCFGTA